MGIAVEFNPDLALRNITEYTEGRRKEEECIPEKLEVGKIYRFLKNGQRNYWMQGEFPLLETTGNQKLSRPLASVVMKEVTHFYEDNQVWTKGTYEVKEIFNGEGIHFEGYTKI